MENGQIFHCKVPMLFGISVADYSLAYKGLKTESN
jgi:hypothetical protein